VHGGQMTYEVEQAILAGRYLLLELFVSERSDALVETADDELPGVERGDGEEFFVCHFDLLFPILG
jgi:hypothetical protein